MCNKIGVQIVLWVQEQKTLQGALKENVCMKGEARTMETTMTREPIWKLWVDTQRRVVSFHEGAGSQLMEFRDREMFLRCIDGYTAQLYRYQ